MLVHMSFSSPAQTITVSYFYCICVTKNYCVTWIIRVYANLVQKLREYLISLCHGD